MSRIWLLSAVAVLALPNAADAARKPVRKPVPTRKIEVVKPSTEPVSGPGFMVPNPVVLRPTSPAESEANAIWSLRAALNIAALQCQFSPFLATVNTYNDFLKAHSEELSRTVATLQAHFKRYDGARGQSTFDQYVTATYQSYSTLDAQYSFCEQAAVTGREALTIPKGALGPVARRDYPIMRGALVPKPLSPALVYTGMPPVDLPDLATVE